MTLSMIGTAAAWAFFACVILFGVYCLAEHFNKHAECMHPANARRKIKLGTPKNQIEHEYCQACGMHKINGVWKKRFIMPDKTALFI